ncbi:MAG: hypothetical protein ACE5JZ_00180 [Kiloniellales bacterium]
MTDPAARQPAARLGEASGEARAGDTLLVALTFDLDPDSFDSSIDTHRTTHMTWRGIEEGVPAILDILERAGAEAGRRAKATWFVRADDHIAAVYGDGGALLDRHESLLGKLSAAGDEIGWHPNLYRRIGERWERETDDDALAAQMRRGAKAMRARGWRPQCSRIGENMGSNRIMQTLEDLGFRYDSTAMPGRSRDDGERRFDWRDTPETPYRPGRADYRRPGEPALNLTEVPMTMVPVIADYDVAPISRYVDLAFHPRALRAGLGACLDQARLLITVSHPSCVLPGISNRPHGLLSFDINAFYENLQLIIEECDRLARPLRFVTLSEGAALFAAMG